MNSEMLRTAEAGKMRVPRSVAHSIYQEYLLLSGDRPGVLSGQRRDLGGREVAAVRMSSDESRRQREELLWRVYQMYGLRAGVPASCNGEVDRMVWINRSGRRVRIDFEIVSVR